MSFECNEYFQRAYFIVRIDLIFHFRHQKFLQPIMYRKSAHFLCLTNLTNAKIPFR